MTRRADDRADDERRADEEGRHERSSDRSQLNMRVRPGELAFWQEASRAAGYGERGFSRWVKDVLTKESVQTLRALDQRYSGKQGE